MYRLQLDPDLSLPASGLTSFQEVWKDHAGKICAYGGQSGGRYWLRFPDLAEFSFHPDDPAAAYRPAPMAREELIFDLFRRTVVPLIYQLGGRAVLHASAVRSDQGVVLFCAHSHTGKSTTASAFHLAGYPFWADDAVVIETHGPELRALRLPARLRLRAPSRNHFQDALDPEELLSRTDPSGRAGEKIAAICLLHRTEESPEQPPVHLAPVPQARAMLQLLEQAYSFTLQEAERRRALLDQYYRVTRALPVWEVRIRSGFDLLPQVVETVATRLHLTPPPASETGAGTRVDDRAAAGNPL